MKMLHVDLRSWLGVVGLAFCLAPPAAFAGEAGSVDVSSTGGSSCTAPDANSEVELSIELSYAQWEATDGESSSTATLDTSGDDLDHTNCTYTLSITETSDDAAVFTASLEGVDVIIDPSDSTPIVVNVTADMDVLAGFSETEIYRGTYDLSMTASPQ